MRGLRQRARLASQAPRRREAGGRACTGFRKARFRDGHHRMNDKVVEIHRWRKLGDAWGLKMKPWRVHRRAWVIVTNTVMLFLVANLALVVLFLAKDKISSFPEVQRNVEPQNLFDQTGAPIDNGERTDYQKDWFDYAAYEGVVDQAYASAVLNNFTHLGKLGFVYQPWVQFAEAPYEGNLVNVDVDPLGFLKRRTRNEEQKEKSSQLRIFVLGGSTTFGYNVSDEHTWPSYLSDVLNKRAKELGLDVQIEITNYGHGYYYSTQEVLLLEQLLRSGHRPNLVIFLDGVNEGQLSSDGPFFTDRLREAMHNLQFPVSPTAEAHGRPPSRDANAGRRAQVLTRGRHARRTRA